MLFRTYTEHKFNFFFIYLLCLNILQMGFQVLKYHLNTPLSGIIVSARCVAYLLPCQTLVFPYSCFILASMGFEILSFIYTHARQQVASIYVCVTVNQSKIFSPVENKFQTTVPTKYSPTETLKTSAQEPDKIVQEEKKHQCRIRFLSTMHAYSCQCCNFSPRENALIPKLTTQMHSRH